MQTAAPRPGGGYGWKGLRLRPDIVGTEDGLAKYPYIRESRRIQAEFTVLEQHTGTDARMKLTGKSKDAESAGQRQWLLLKKQDPYCRPGEDVTVRHPHSVLSGLTIEQLLAANPKVKDPDKISIGDELTIPVPVSGADDGTIDGGSASP